MEDSDPTCKMHRWQVRVLFI
uniref:Uncharacterized protein n=1 Tax=Arundo donax TaxID=35708 RepID=A0A0A9CAE6_ARUDO